MAGRSNLYDFRKRSGNSVALSAGSRRDGLGLERSLGCTAVLSSLLLLDKMSLRILVGAEEVSDLLGKSSLKLLLKIDQLLLKHKACYFCFLLTEKIGTFVLSVSNYSTNIRFVNTNVRFF